MNKKNTRQTIDPIFIDQEIVRLSQCGTKLMDELKETNARFRIVERQEKYANRDSIVNRPIYYIQEFKKGFLWSKKKWRNFKVESCWGCDCSWEPVTFPNLIMAKEYLKDLKEMHK